MDGGPIVAPSGRTRPDTTHVPQAAGCAATFGETGVGDVTCPLVGPAAGAAGSSAFGKLTHAVVADLDDVYLTPASNR